jgi:hypothetical protein
MDANLFAIERCVSQRLADARAASARHALVAWARRGQPGVLGMLGLALIRIERRLRRHQHHRAGREPLLSLPEAVSRIASPSPTHPGNGRDGGVVAL